MAQAAWQKRFLTVVDAIWEQQAKQLRRIGIHPHWLELDQHKTPGLQRMRVLRDEDRGNGPVWIYIHGFSAQGMDWGPLLRHMAPRCAHSIALDLPGHGATPPLPGEVLTPACLLGAAQQAVEQLVPEGRGAVLVANSMGGVIAVQLAAHLPKLIRATVLISPYGAPYSDDVHAALIETFSVTDWPKAKAFVHKLFPHGQIPPPGLRVSALAVWAHLNRPRILSLRSNSVAPLTPQALSAMPPTLLVWGTADHIMPRVGLEFFRKHLPAKSTQVITPSRFSHLPQLDLAPQLAGEMLSWAETWPGLLAGDAEPRQRQTGT